MSQLDLSLPCVQLQLCLHKAKMRESQPGKPVWKFPGFLFPFINVERSLIPENLADSYTFFLHAELQGHLLFFCDDIAELQGHEKLF